MNENEQPNEQPNAWQHVKRYYGPLTHTPTPIRPGREKCLHCGQRIERVYRESQEGSK